MESLLAEREWVRRLARTLARDEAGADDVEQEAWLAATERPPVDASTPRAWLATVMRRRLGRDRRASARRERRERAAARVEATSSTLEVVERAEWHARLVQAVTALPEPYRTTVLLRWFEGLAPREVAARTGSPVETVRSRAQRALALLRSRLDEEHGGDRAAWAAPLLQHASGGRPPPGIGVLAMTTGTKLLLSAGAVVAAVAAVLIVRPWAAPSAERGSAPTPEAEPAAGAEGPRLARRPGGSPASAEPEVAVARTWAGRVRVVEAPSESGRPIEGATLVAFGAGGERHEATTGADGLTPGFATGAGPFASAWVSAPGFALERLEGLDPASSPSVALHAVPDLLVRFTVDGRSASPEEARSLLGGVASLPVWWMPDPLLANPDPVHLLRLWTAPPGTWRREGRIELGEVVRVVPRPGPGSWWASVARPGDQAWTGRVEIDATGEVVVPLRSRVETVRVRVLDADTGAPLPAATAVPWSEIGDDLAFVPGAAVTTDAHGEFPAPVPADAPRGSRNATWWVSTEDRVAAVPPYQLVAARGGTLDVRLPRHATVRGRAFLPDGRPATGHLLTAMRKGKSASTRVAEDGSFVLRGVPADAPNARLMLIGDLSRMEVTMREVPVSPGAEVEALFGVPAGTQPTGTLRGRLTAGGRPLAGVVVLIGRDDGTMWTTDADGRWRADGLPPGDTHVHVLLGTVGVADDFGLVTTTPLRVDAGGETVADLDLPGGAIRVRVVDAATGAPVPRAYVLVSPVDRAEVRDRYPGWAFHPGWAAPTGADGVVTLPALVPRARHAVKAVRPSDRAEGTADVPSAGTHDAPTEVVVRIALPEGGR
jgi:RNA polymerase sigma-70 factor (ECF subfamily)